LPAAEGGARADRMSRAQQYSNNAIIIDGS
jgi:hypothetical protein